MPTASRRHHCSPRRAPHSFIGVLLAVAPPPLEHEFVAALLAASNGALLRVCRRALSDALVRGRVAISFWYAREHVELTYAGARTSVRLEAPEGSRVHAMLSSLRTGVRRSHLHFEAALRARLGEELRIGYDTSTHTLVLDWSEAAAAAAAR